MQHDLIVLLLAAAAVLFVLAAVLGTTSPRTRNWHFWAGLGLAAFFAALLVEKWPR